MVVPPDVLEPPFGRCWRLQNHRPSTEKRLLLEFESPDRLDLDLLAVTYESTGNGRRDHRETKAQNDEREDAAASPCLFGFNLRFGGGRFHSGRVHVEEFASSELGAVKVEFKNGDLIECHANGTSRECLYPSCRNIALLSSQTAFPPPDAATAPLIYRLSPTKRVIMLHAKGPLLTVDVTDRTVEETDIDDLLAAEIGGRAAATRLAHDRIPFDADPFGPENRAYLSTGPLQQSQMSFTGRMNMTGLSPLTDGLLSTNAGGYLSRNFVDTGYSVFEVVGASDDLLAVHVTDEGIEFEEIPHLEGALVPEVSDHMAETRNLGPEHCITIGPAGENLVRFASVMTFDSRAFGRGGLGAVLGSKNVKCVTFEGDSPPDVEVPEDPAADVHREAATSDDIMRRQGTTSGTEFINDNFSLPTRYFSEMSFEHAADIGGVAVEEKKYKKGACSQCAYACKLPTRDEETGIETEGPEFETVYSFGSNQGVGNIVDVMKANKLCDDLGMDTISAGVTVAAYLASEDEFGNAELAQEITEQIAYREGVGDRLAEGVARIHDELGVENYTVKGMEFAAHDGRVLHGLGLQYSVANRGADHMYGVMQSLEYRGGLDPTTLEGKPETLVRQENSCALRDSGIVCAFAGDYVTEERYEALFDADYGDLLTVGSHTVERERHFNNRRGFDRDDDRVPYADRFEGFEAAVDEYYELRGWNDDGTVSDLRFDSPASADD